MTDLQAPVLSLWHGWIERPAPQTLIKWRQVIRDVAERNGLSVDELKSPSRARRFAWARQEAMWELRQLKRADGTPRFSFPQIARMVGLTDHSSAVHGCKRYEERRNL